MAEEFKDLRSNRKRRNQTARRAVLLWLEDEYHEGGTSPNIDGFSSSKHGTFMGDPYSEAEVDAATNRGRDAGYLEGTAAFGGGVVRPTITNKGLLLSKGAKATHPPPSPARAGIIDETDSIKAVVIASEHRADVLQQPRGSGAGAGCGFTGDGAGVWGNHADDNVGSYQEGVRCQRVVTVGGGDALLVGLAVGGLALDRLFLAWRVGFAASTSRLWE